MVEQEGIFQSTHFRVAIPFNYGQPSSSIGGTLSPRSLRYLFQWSDDEREASGYTYPTIISSVQIGSGSANMADNNNNDDLRRHMEEQE